MIKLKKIRYHRKRVYLIAFLLILVIGVFVGYAALTTKLSIDGVLNVQKTSWGVNFDTINVESGSIEATTPARVEADTTITFAARLDNPEDFYAFTTNVKNTGTINAKLDSIKITPDLEEEEIQYLTISITYENGEEVKVGDILDADDTKKVKVSMKYVDGLTEDKYPTEDKTFQVKVTLNYVQNAD